MKTLILSLLTFVTIVGATLWFQPQLLSTIGFDQQIQFGNFSLANTNDGSGSNKCTTVSGDVIYGTISKPEDCLKIESIDTHITIVESALVDGKSALLGDNLMRNTTDFNCDGRTHCAQMRSCQEARFFLANCSNTQVDGDQDGIPCERQWCR
ncbi:MAG: hypothetical protein ACI9XU_001541 [Arenicella sp.]|jgi:hypothetical protein